MSSFGQMKLNSLPNIKRIMHSFHPEPPKFFCSCPEPSSRNLYFLINLSRTFMELPEIPSVNCLKFAKITNFWELCGMLDSLRWFGNRALTNFGPISASKLHKKILKIYQNKHILWIYGFALILDGKSAWLSLLDLEHSSLIT